MDELGYIMKDDLEAFEVRLVKKISDLIIKITSKESICLKSDEAKKILGCSASTLQNLRKSGIIPFSKIGGTIYYEYYDILRVLEESKAHRKPEKNTPKEKLKYVDEWNQ